MIPPLIFVVIVVVLDEVVNNIENSLTYNCES
jgi:hypothetical protein